MQVKLQTNKLLRDLCQCTDLLTVGRGRILPVVDAALKRLLVDPQKGDLGFIEEEAPKRQHKTRYM
jgi:hypothetical protein